MYIVLCSAMDTSAQWAARGLHSLLPYPVELVFAESLALGVHWEHRLQRDGTTLTITLSDGRVLNSSQIKGVLNRLVAPSPGTGKWVSETENEYVRSEMFAFYLSWLNGLPGIMINRPTPTCLTGRFLRQSQWLYKAAHAGLKTAPYRVTETDVPQEMYALPMPQGAMRQSLIVAGDAIFPDCVPASVKAGCVLLTREAGMELLGAELYLGENGEWCFCGATVTPDLRLGGLPLVTRMAAMLTKKAKN